MSEQGYLNAPPLPPRDAIRQTGERRRIKRGKMNQTNKGQRTWSEKKNRLWLATLLIEDCRTIHMKNKDEESERHKYTKRQRRIK